jgi:spermidine/putrescine transport system ATP-binding protein
VVIRPERLQIATAGPTGANQVPAMVDRLVYLGPVTQVVVRLPHGPELQVLVANDKGAEIYVPGTPVTLTFPADALRLLAASPPLTADDPAPAVP